MKNTGKEDKVHTSHSERLPFLTHHNGDTKSENAKPKQ